MFFDHLDTPIGPLLLVADEQGLTCIGLPHRGIAQEPPQDALHVEHHPRPMLPSADLLSSPSNPAARSCSERSSAREPVIRKRANSPSKGRALLRAAQKQFEEYFAGRRHTFDLPLHPHGTPFQLEVWGALLAIPYGETASYAQIAQRIGRPGAVRAVGAANGANPLAIIVPCHRVIGSDGDLTGYGGGLAAKRWLLAHERRFAPRTTLVLEP